MGKLKLVNVGDTTADRLIVTIGDQTRAIEVGELLDVEVGGGESLNGDKAAHVVIGVIWAPTERERAAASPTSDMRLVMQKDVRGVE